MFGIGLICFSNLLLEIVFTRIFSSTMYYHFTFLSIALALFGLGASGVYVFVHADRYTPERARQDLATNARRFAGFTVLAVVYILANPVELVQGKLSTGTEVAEFSQRALYQLILISLFSALPFFFAGMVVSLAMAHYRKHVNRVYFWDLCGAGLAALLAGSLLGLFGGPTLVLFVAALAVGGAAVFERPRGGGWLPLGLVVALFVVNIFTSFVRVPSVKGVDAQQVKFEAWNTFSHVTVGEAKPGEFVILIDASAATAISSSARIPGGNWKGTVAALAFNLFDKAPSTPPRALIIGPGGGPDVVNALAAGATSVTGVEVNPIIADQIMRDRFLEQSGRLYLDPRVHIVTDEGRSFIRRSTERFDVLQATLVDTWAATAAGAFALTENTLYTVEAFIDYFQHTTDRGVVTMSRWYDWNDPESQRLIVLAAGALEKLGVPVGETRKHLYFAHQGSLGTLIAKRTAFTDEEVTRLDEACAREKFTRVVSPKTDGTSELERLVDRGAWGDVVRAHPKDLSPPTDDRPFFFYFVKPADLFDFTQHFSGGARTGNPSIWILIALGFTLFGITGAFIIWPLLAHGGAVLTRSRPRELRRRVVALLYFALLGLAFITVEIALLQKFSFFLGHPSHALLVVLFSILIATAVGARFAGGRFGRALPTRILIGGALLATVCVIYAVVLGPALGAWVAWPLPARVIVSGLLIAPVGLLMGIMLPAGINLIADSDPRVVPWAWGLNGATSVIGTVSATVLAIHSGFTMTLVAGALLYGLAGVMGLALGRVVNAIRTPAAEWEDNPTDAGGPRSRVPLIGVAIAVALVATVLVWRGLGSRSRPAEATLRAEITLVTADRDGVDCSSRGGIQNFHCGYSDGQTSWPVDEQQRLRPYLTLDRRLFLIPGLFLHPALAEKVRTDPPNKPFDQLKRFTARCTFKAAGEMDDVRVRWLSTSPWTDPQKAQVATVVDCKVEG